MSIGTLIGWSSGTRDKGDRVRIGSSIGFGSPVPVPDTRPRFSAGFGLLLRVQDLHLQRPVTRATGSKTAGAGG